MNSSVNGSSHRSKQGIMLKKKGIAYGNAEANQKCV